MATASELFQKAGFVARKKGQRYPKRVLDTFTFETRLPEKSSGFTVLGQFEGNNEFGFLELYDALTITLENGACVPCWRRHSAKNNYAIIQSSNFFVKNPE